MKHLILTILCAAALLFTNSLQAAAEVKTYQVTGPILEVTPTTVTVQKGDEKWQIARTKDTDVAGDLKVGSKATVTYQMIATSVQVKDAKGKKK
ncbi:hypothetical protein [Pedosphaera parvula]|uniref:DUF5666 domain-containing protein n=1 Tax=Pedosphaera parvula (strain Ellin514) TaxID=320771 RepID=B9XPN4_PEDPL|nr:hypothetical protein [Pedosphaera parvula]EEF58157.1 conserved hypothetical protein [Pedosphaera parvula Ellin514]